MSVPATCIQKKNRRNSEGEEHRRLRELVERFLLRECSPGVCQRNGNKSWPSQWLGRPLEITEEESSVP